MAQGIFVYVTDCSTGQPIPGQNLGWEAPEGQVVQVPGFGFVVPLGTPPGSNGYAIDADPGTQINISASYLGNYDYYASATITVIDGQFFYNICLKPQLCVLIVQIVDATNGSPIGQSEVVSSNPEASFSMQSSGVFVALVNPGSSYAVTVNGGELYNSGNNFTQSTPILSTGMYTMTIELIFALPLPPQDGGAGCYIF